MEKIPIIDANDKNLNNKLKLAFLTITGSSAYRNDRDRPYNGQPQTDHGERGKTEIKGLTMRDLSDCIAMAFLQCSDNKQLSNSVVEINKDMKGTKYEKKNIWRYDDIYKIDVDNMDPGAVIKSALCFVENMMGIYPNVPELTTEQMQEKFFSGDITE